MPATLSSDAMSADEAWSWLIDRSGEGLRVRNLTVWMPAPGIVEVCAANDSVGMDHDEFLTDFGDADFYPLDVAYYGGAA